MHLPYLVLQLDCTGIFLMHLHLISCLIHMYNMVIISVISLDHYDVYTFTDVKDPT